MKLYTRAQVMRLADIGKTQYYRYLEALNIKTKKVAGVTGITEEQLRQILARKQRLHPEVIMHETIIDSQEGTPESPPKPFAGHCGQHLSGIPPHSSESLQNLLSINVNDLDLSNPEDLALLIEIAKARKVRQILQPELILAHIIGQLSEEDLDPHHLEEIAETRKLLRYDLENPQAIARRILDEYKSE